MRKKNITTSDIAKAAGVSRTTVSFVLNNKRAQNISEETKKKILKIAKELGYKPNKEAIELAKTGRYNIGLIVDISECFHFSDAFLSIVFESMRKNCKRNRDRLFYIPFNLTNSNYQENIAKLNLDAAIVLFPKENSPLIKEFEQKEFPFVVLGSIENKSVVSVDIDNYEAAKKATKYLIKSGLKEIAMISHAPLEYAAANHRMNGFLDAMKEANCKINKNWLIEANFNVESGYKAAYNLWQQSKKPEAIFCGNDEIALGAMIYLNEHEVKIPEEISIIGFDDDPMSEYLYPALTTVAVPGIELANQCISQIYSLLENNKLKKKNIILPSQIVIRDTVKSK